MIYNFMFMMIDLFWEVDQNTKTVRSGLDPARGTEDRWVQSYSETWEDAG